MPSWVYHPIHMSNDGSIYSFLPAITKAVMQLMLPDHQLTERR